MEIVSAGRVVLSLAFVLGLFFVLVVVLRKTRSSLAPSQPGAINLIDQLALDIGRRAVLIEADGKRSLIILSKEGAEHVWTANQGSVSSGSSGSAAVEERSTAL